MCYYLVTGEANFSIKNTSLTIGGFNQPNIARNLTGNAEKGLSQRFLWICPKPVYSSFTTLEPVDQNFTDRIGENFSSLNYVLTVLYDDQKQLVC